MKHPSVVQTGTSLVPFHAVVGREYTCREFRSALDQMNDICCDGGAWLDRASALPVAFAQVREDALLDVDVARSAGEGAKVAMVASGGCTVALLASTAGVAHVHFVDPNPAQLALTRLKLRLLASAAPNERLALLGHASMAPADRAARLAEELGALAISKPGCPSARSRWSLGSAPTMRDASSSCLRRYAGTLHGCVEPLEDLLSLGDPARQAERVTPRSTLGQLH